MVSNPKLFEVERQNGVMILTLLRNLGEFVMMESQEETETILASFEKCEVPNLLVDFCKTDYLDSTALGFLAALHKRVTKCQGRMVCCNASQYERQLLGITNLYKLIPVFDTRGEAVEALRNQN